MSYENRPVGSVFDASMSPRSSLTTNVLPSRIRTGSRPSSAPPLAHGARARRLRHAHRRREQALDTDQEARVAVQRHGAAERGGHRVAASAGHQVEVGLVGADDAVRLAVAAGDTASAPSLIARSHWSVRPPSTMSKRTVARILPSSGSCPRFDRSSKKSAVASANTPTSGHPRPRLGRAPPSRGRDRPVAKRMACHPPCASPELHHTPPRCTGKRDSSGATSAPRVRRDRRVPVPPRRRAGPRTIASTSASRARSPTPITVPTPAARAAAIAVGRVLEHDRVRRVGAQAGGGRARSPPGPACRASTSSAVTNTGGRAIPDAASRAVARTRLPEVHEGPSRRRQRREELACARQRARLGGQLELESIDVRERRRRRRPGATKAATVARAGWPWHASTTASRVETASDGPGRPRRDDARVRIDEHAVAVEHDRRRLEHEDAHGRRPGAHAAGQLTGRLR